MSAGVEWQCEDGIAVVTLSGPPVNALSRPLREGLAAALDAAEAAPEARAIVLCGGGRAFSAGADVTEFGKPVAGPPLPDLCNRLEACAKPVVAALQGAALGGGLELALAAHYRVAAPDAQLGLPEVTLGLLPGAGGTQRLPRIVGAEAALRLMLTGQPMRAATAQGLGLVDALAEGEPLAAARDFARRLIAEGRGPRPTRDRTEGLRDPARFVAAVTAARELRGDPALPAPARIADCVEAALLLPFESGLDFERAAFEELMETEAAQGLRHAFLAERRAQRPPAGVPARPVGSVALIGGGLPLLCTAMLRAGLRVTLIERDRAGLAQALERVALQQEQAVSAGRLTPEARDADWERLAGGTEFEAATGADLAIEALAGSAAAKAAVLGRIGELMPPETVILTTGAGAELDELAAATGRPEDVLGLHLPRALPGLRLLELVTGGETAPAALATALALARRIGRPAMRAPAVPGHVAHRLLLACLAAGDWCLAEGAVPEQVDAALTGYGFAAGPYRMADRLGLDRLQQLSQQAGGGRRFGLLDRLLAAGRTGQGAGRGYFRYDQGRDAAPDPSVAALIAAERLAVGTAGRSVPADEIAARCLSAMANAGARMVEAGEAAHPSDLDVAAIAALGFPRWRGGPMRCADFRGLLGLRKELLAFAADDPALWDPSPLVLDLVKNGRRFCDLDAG